jgi:hypothetical protein
MLPTLALLLPLATAPATPPPSPAPAAVARTPAPAPAPVKLAAPGFSTVEVPAERARFLNDYLSEQLMQQAGGRLRVTTESEVAAVLGLERQKALLGCSDGSSSCLAEIAGALGVDGVVVGNVARFGGDYAVTLKVVSARDGALLASASSRSLKEGALLEWMAEAAQRLARQLVPDAAAAAPVAVGRHDNAVRLALVGGEYTRRLQGAWWVGARASAFAAFTSSDRRLGGLSHLAAVARWQPVELQAGFSWGAYGVLGYGGAGLLASPGGGEQTVGGPLFGAGAEVGYQGLRASLEALVFGNRILFLPGLSFAVTF